MNPFDRQHLLLHHLVEQRHDAVDVLRRVHDLDQDRKILRQAEDPRRVQPRVGTESFDPANDGRACQALRADALDDRLVERLAVPRVRLADEEPEKLPLALELHSVLATTTPR